MTGEPHELGNGLRFGEHVILEVRRHWAVPAGQVLATAPLVLAILFGAWRFDRDGGLLALGSGFGIVALWIAIPVLRWSADSLTLTDRRVVAASGVLVRRRTAIPFEEITSVTPGRQTAAGRLLGYGTITIGTAIDSVAITFRQVPAGHVLRDRLLANAFAHRLRRAPLDRPRRRATVEPLPSRCGASSLGAGDHGAETDQRPA
ncbi:MAG TPA: PH domain-containing protein [Candidatus Dormibacteraeota bacterium]